MAPEGVIDLAWARSAPELGRSRRREPAPSIAGDDRIASVDALRGFALFGIVVVHMVEQYTAAPAPTTQPAFGVFSALDWVVRGAVTLLFMGKFFSMFSLLFGVSCFIQKAHAAARTEAFQGRFVGRLVVLFGIGLVHHAFYRGDILSTFAVLGLLLVPFSRATDRTLLTTAAILCLGVPRLLLVGLATYGVPVPDAPNMDAANDAYYQTLKGPSLLAVFASNMTHGVRTQWEYQLGMFGRAYQSLGLFLLGLYAGRRGWHGSIAEFQGPLRRLMTGGLVVGVVTGCLFAALFVLQGLPPRVSWTAVVDFMLYDVFNVALTVSFASAFLLLYLRPRAGRLLRHLAPVGRMALTTYVCQSLVGTFLYYGYGLNLLGEIGAAAAFGLAVLVFSGQILASEAWLRSFRFGPLEWLWRSLTYGRMESLWR